MTLRPTTASTLPRQANLDAGFNHAGIPDSSFNWRCPADGNDPSLEKVGPGPAVNLT
jgi:hypothetical protein